MKKFDRILRETYKLLQEQDPNAPADPNAPVDPNADPNAAAKVGAAAPPAEGDDVTKTLSADGEVTLVKIAYKAIEGKDNIPSDLKSKLDSLLPAGVDSITKENAKEVTKIIDDIVNPAEGLDSSEETDKQIIGTLPTI
jgi:hypothetical protein